METEAPKHNKTRKILIWGLGIATITTAGYFGWRWLVNRKNSKDQYDTPDLLPASSINPKPTQVTLPKTIKPAPRNDGFPLKKGSRGAQVKVLQDAMIAKYGSSILPKYGADGDFGAETVTALQKLGLPPSIDESTFNVIVKGGGIDAQKTAQTLYQAASGKNFKQALDALKTLRSKEDYTAVSELFKNYRISGGVRQTLVNGILSSFTDESQKQAFRLEFTRMGLTYDGSKWALSGLDAPSLITTEQTQVWVDANRSITVPASLVLGKQVGSKGEYYVFENAGKRFLVKARAVTYV